MSTEPISAPTAAEATTDGGLPPIPTNASDDYKYGYGPVDMKCPICDQQIRTRVSTHAGKGAYWCCCGMATIW